MWTKEKISNGRKNSKLGINLIHTSFLNKIFQGLSANVLKYSIHSFSIQLLLCLISKLNIFKQSFLLVFSLRCSQARHILPCTFIHVERDVMDDTTAAWFLNLMVSGV